MPWLGVYLMLNAGDWHYDFNGVFTLAETETVADGIGFCDNVQKCLR